ncbi:hypothetical protein MMC26_002298 [Xylographa opegraphella]|nr:hypothetical protein [Xylographa opegraphella]
MSTSTTSTTTTTTTSCVCPTLPTPTVTQIATATSVATVSVPAPPVVSTVYPCADPLPSPGPAYGDYSDNNDLGLQNSLYYLNTPEGASASACCNACLFEVPNCIQAYFYFYEGCVVSQATNLGSASGSGVSSSCPAGTFNGLSYGPDVDPAFRSTGNIIGPCGQAYTNNP